MTGAITAERRAALPQAGARRGTAAGVQAGGTEKGGTGRGKEGH